MEDEQPAIQATRLINMLAFEPDDDSYDRVYAEYNRLAAELPAMSLLLFKFGGNYEMYWDRRSPGRETALAATQILGLRAVHDGSFFSSWFNTFYHDEIVTKLAANGIAVRYGEPEPGEGLRYRVVPLWDKGL